MKLWSILEKLRFSLAISLLLWSFGWLGLANGAELNSVVAENPYNRAARQLEAKSQALDQREASLEELEQNLAQSYYQVFAAIGLLFMLILINFLLDHQRRRKALLKQI
jgi:NADH:ubiquinone oxidoreductase subunit 2 (subunit N)